MSKQDARYAVATALATVRDVKPVLQAQYQKARTIQELAAAIETAVGMSTQATQRMAKQAFDLSEMQRQAFHAADALDDTLESLHKTLGRTV